jgi:flagellar biosynthesis protein FlhF
MNLQTFKAPTMAIALQQVKSAMGPEAVILHTRTYQLRDWMGLRRRDVVEVTAGRGLAGGQNGRRRQPPAAAPTLGPPDDSTIASVFAPRSPGGSVAGLSLYAQQNRQAAAPPRPAAQQPATVAPRSAAGPVAIDPVTNGQTLLAMPAAGNALILSVSNEVAALKQMVKDLVTETRHNASPKVPEELFDYYLNLIQNSVAEELAVDIVKSLSRDLRPDQLTRPDVIRERVAELIERLVPSCGPIVRKQTPGPHVLALIGPTGVGKTTTLAKLAANLKLKEGHRVGLITLDTYRIAAVDQLRRYADIIGSPLKVVSNPDELRAAVAGMSNLDFVLIDTAGRSPRDTPKLNELRELLDAIQPDDVHLVLSSTSGQESVELAYQRFSEVRVDKMIFTKLDEASHVGVVLNVCHKVNKALSYVTTGQDVPNDIEVGRGRLLAKMILADGPGAPPKLPAK